MTGFLGILERWKVRPTILLPEPTRQVRRLGVVCEHVTITTFVELASLVDTGKRAVERHLNGRRTVTGSRTFCQETFR